MPLCQWQIPRRHITVSSGEAISFPTKFPLRRGGARGCGSISEDVLTSDARERCIYDRDPARPDHRLETADRPKERPQVR